MKYTIKQISKILNIQEFVDMSNTLSKVYLDFENKEYFIDTFSDMDRIYKIYCASIYNLVKAIQDSKEYFTTTKKYEEFENIINQEYTAVDSKYYEKENYKTSLFKIIETIRHQVNHSLKNDEDNNILFAAYVDFGMLENLRMVINEIFSEVYNQIDKTEIKKIVLNKPKIKYSADKLSDKIEKLKFIILESSNRLNESLKEDGKRAVELFNLLFDISYLYDLLMKDPLAIKKFSLIDKEMQELLELAEIYINESGTKLEKKAFQLFKKFIMEEKEDSIKNVKNSVLKLQDELNKLKNEYNENI